MIRGLQEKDIEAVNELGNTLNSNFSKTANLHGLDNDNFTKVLVYEKEEQIIGFLMYTELEETADVVDIVVKEEYRQKRVASCLLDAMISELKDSVKLLTLEVRKSNVAAISLYKKFGFEIINTRKKYYANQEDAYLMGRRLEK